MRVAGRVAAGSDDRRCRLSAKRWESRGGRLRSEMLPTSRYPSQGMRGIFGAASVSYGIQSELYVGMQRSARPLVGRVVRRR